MANRRAPFTKAEKEKMGILIASKKYSDIQLAKRFKCSKTTIKIIRTKKYRQLKKKRRKYDEKVKQAVLTMYKEDKMTVIQIARQLRIRYWAVWEIINRSGLKEKSIRRTYQHVINRDLFNYSRWLESFLAYLARKLRIRNFDNLKEWIHDKKSQSLLENYLKDFNELINENQFMERNK